MPENPANSGPPTILKIIKLTPEIENGNTKKISINDWNNQFSVLSFSVGNNQNVSKIKIETTEIKYTLILSRQRAPSI